MRRRYLLGVTLLAAGVVTGCESGSRVNSASKPMSRPTNRLARATSPYLLQHQHNPVDWHEWGEEALSRARREDKPIFLSIGYSACHWCHVMERESFENESVAEILNRHFVCIKVDREERPDLDDIYMAATQAMTGSGGWPMSVWLTPDLKPFYTGTYFPPEDHYGRPGFKRLLTFLADAWENQREKCLEQAGALTEAVRRISVTPTGTQPVPHDVVIETAVRLTGAFDRRLGGMSGGGTNKFPPSMAMDLMLRAHHHLSSHGAEQQAKARELLEPVELTLEKMAYGGIYDQLGGGIARYSTDERWLVPHFEKMLYDQALVSGIYLDAYRLTRKPLYARIAREIFDYVIADLQGPEGGLYSTRDADSEGHEGKYYVWSRAEVMAALGPETGALFCDYYDVTEEGNWEGQNILNVPRPAETVAKLNRISVETLDRHLSAGRNKLLAIRAKRVAPHLDDKVLASWNGLMIASLARGSRILSDAKYRDAAARAADFVLTKMVVDGRLKRVYREGRTHTIGFLDDHAFMIEALLNLYEATFDPRWLAEAERMNAAVLVHFRDDAGGFFFTADDAERLVVRAKEANDSAIPSGNSVQLMNLLRLAVLLDRKDLTAEAEKLIRAFSGQLLENPYRSERMLAALDFYHHGPREIAFVSETSDDAALQAMVDAAWSVYVPNQVHAGLLTRSMDAASVGRRVPLLASKTLVNGRAAAYVCRDFACQAPTSDPAALKAQLMAK